MPNRFVTLEVHDVTDADPLGNEPLFDARGRIVGRATAGSYGHVLGQEPGDRLRRAGSSLRSARELVIEVLGERKRATVLVDSPFDPQNQHLKA